jgi:hypothetical protein
MQHPLSAGALNYAACGAISTMRSASSAAEIRVQERDGRDDAASFEAMSGCIEKA